MRPSSMERMARHEEMASRMAALRVRSAALAPGPARRIPTPVRPELLIPSAFFFIAPGGCSSRRPGSSSFLIREPEGMAGSGRSRTVRRKVSMRHRLRSSAPLATGTGGAEAVRRIRYRTLTFRACAHRHKGVGSRLLRSSPATRTWMS
jgi:hypothetical protein